MSGESLTFGARMAIGVSIAACFLMLPQQIEPVLDFGSVIELLVAGLIFCLLYKFWPAA